MMSSPSFSYGESLLSHLEKVQELPAEVQADIARRVDIYITIARAAKDEALLEQLASSAMEEQGQGHRTGGQYDGPAMGCTSNCRGMVLC